jgi:hypothetical protein
VFSLPREHEPEDRHRVLLSEAKKAAAFLQDLTLPRQDLDLASQPAQLVTLGAAQPFGLALVDIELVRPVPERLPRHTELLGQQRPTGHWI